MKTKTVFDTNEIAHLWANQSQDYARNAHNNFYFRGATIYSYGSHFPIATISGNDVLFTLERYSNTTAKHIQKAKSAISHKNIIYCYDVPVYFDYASNKHENNVNYWKRKITELFDELGNKKIRNTENRINDIQYNINQLNRYVDYFKFTIEDKKLLSMLKIANEPDFIEHAREAKAKKEADLKDKLQQAEKAYEKYIALWRKNEVEKIKKLNDKTKALCNFYNKNSDAYTRLRYLSAENVVETSKGIKIPVNVARKAFVKLNGCFNNDCNNLSIPVMQYTITEATKSYIKAGCHTIPNKDIKYISTLLGWQ